MSDEQYMMKLLRDISCDVSAKANKIFEPYGLTCIQFDILMQLYQESNLTISTVAKRLHMSISNISAILIRLEKHGFIERIRDEKDHRIIRIQLCEKANQMLEEMHTCTFQKEMLFQGMKEEDMKTIIKGLELLYQILKECDLDE